MEEISLTIDGKAVSCAPGTTILDAARKLGVSIPTLCHHEDLKPAGACRICLVEDENSRRILASCVTPVAADMVIRTDSPAVLHHRANVIRLIMANHPESCIVCDQGNRCGLREIAADLGIGRIDLYPMPRYFRLEEANPFIVRDLSKCILCGRCIRADRELVVVGAIDYHFRGFDAHPATLHQEPLENSTCTFCGTCVTLCPTGALRPKTTGYAGSPEQWAPSICGFCGVGCAVRLGSTGGRLVEVEPGGQTETVNRSTLCIRGHFEQDFLGAADRLLAPRLRRDGESVEVPWPEAMGAVAEAIRSVCAENGPQSIAFLGSSNCTVEENYLFQKTARALVGTNNVLLDAFDDPLADRLIGLQPFEIRRIEESEAVLVIGANPTDTHPVLGYALKRAARWKGVPLVVLDPAGTDLAPFARSWLRPAPFGESEVLDALAAAMLQAGGLDPVKGEGFDELKASLSRMDLDDVCRRNGLEPDALHQAARILQGKRIVFVVGEHILSQPFGERAICSLRNLALLTGSVRETGERLLVPAAECNRVGALDMGISRRMLPGRMPLEHESNRHYWERLWGGRISPDPGLSPSRLIQEAEKGNLKALYVMGENPLRSFPQPGRVREAFEKLDLLVVQDILETETAALAHVILPGAAFAEKHGTFTNLEARVQTFTAAIPPPGEARPDWRILCDLFNGLSPSNGSYSEIDDIRREIRDHVPGYENISFRRTEDSPPMFRGSLPAAGEDVLSYSPPGGISHDRKDADYPFLAVFESPRRHMGSGTRTSRSGSITFPGSFRGLEVSPEDAGLIGIQSGDRVRVVSASGSIEREAEVSGCMRPGMIRVATGLDRNDAMGLLPIEGEGVLSRACPVRMEKP
ncbi:MAG: molybdopterin-dependent oxidoreductase [Desulfatiglandales bacterium]